MNQKPLIFHWKISLDIEQKMTGFMLTLQKSIKVDSTEI